jgi:hypothetical protein
MRTFRGGYAVSADVTRGENIRTEEEGVGLSRFCRVNVKSNFTNDIRRAFVSCINTLYN